MTKAHQEGTGDLWVAEYVAGLSMRQVAQKHDVTERRVRYAVKQAGVQSRNAGSYPRPLKDIPHGSHNCYVTRGCRCGLCMEGNAAYQRDGNRSRHRRMVAGEISPVHGRADTYRNYMCRCAPCLAAHMVQCRATAAKRKARST